MARYQIDSDVLIYATSVAGPERTRLLELADSTATLLTRNARDFAGIRNLQLETVD